MTAEIAVANKVGLAIAADSAVTVEQLYKNKIVTKVYNSANKIFTLSKWRPVGAMIYNTTTLGGTPWEIIIKDYREKLGRKSFNTLEEYKNDFFALMQSTGYLFPEQSVKEIVLFNVYRLLKAILDESKNAAEFKSNLDERIAKLEKIDYVEGFDAAFEKKITRTYKSEISAASAYVLKPAYIRGCTRQIERLVQVAFTRKERLRGYSGLVICGFGEEEVFPRLLEYICDIVVCGKIRVWKKQEAKIGRDQGSFVLPFADTAVIRTIIDGINPDFRNKQYVEAIRVIASMPKEVLSQVTQLNQSEKDAYALAANTSIIEAFKDFLKSMDDYRKDEYTVPIDQTISLLPLSDLATIAETLLNASHIHKRLTPNLESVGGPVDVAVISKGDGFVWIKRKHYFEEKLNRSYATKYLDSGAP